ncbi:M23 family metallopeptidase [Vibrio brasiliensis]|uniref:peptidoglycan DD-metalloendopeptidase family protein n=1 Tax=Vibrio brasiliensis TaxID=170652 RepID=UPI001EFDDA92|nr:M23 family metallopeptidase [Vibrio brasiliensis]MCG9647035.1 M23 family metallopeptidase [Vibrio brasiliensis]
MKSSNLTVAVSGVAGTRFLNLSPTTIRRIKLSLLFAILVFGALVTVLVLKLGSAADSQRQVQQLSDKAQQLEQLLAEKELQLTQQLNDKEQLKQELVYVEQKLTGIESAMSLPDEALELRERADIAALSTAARHQMLQLIPSGKPVKVGYLSSKYGRRTHPVKKTWKMHRGIDYAVNIGTPIYAPADGVVELTRKSNKGSGNFLRLIHSFGFTSSYSHLKAFKVKPGEYVKKGDLIALSGNTGLSTGYHLHYEVRLVGRALDPLPFTQWEMNNFAAIFESNKDVKWDYLVNKIENRIATSHRLSSLTEPTSVENSNLLVTSK